MLEALLNYGLFLVKAVTIVAAILITFGSLANAVRRAREELQEQITVKPLNQRYDAMANALRHEILSAPALKKLAKDKKAEQKTKDKAAKKGEEEKRKNIFVLDFDGDVRASAVTHLREEITAILTVATEHDEVVLRLESPGGMVHGYGLASSQLERIRAKNIRLTVAVDKVAASGGYMMACIADNLISAPFAVIGSVGVVAQLPNFNKLLKKHDVDYEMFTAGEYKRTVTVLGENTDQARQKFKEELEDTHELFKDFVKTNRPVVDIDRIATGEHWYGKRALDLQLVDSLQTSDDYLLEQHKNADLFHVNYTCRQPLGEKIMHKGQAAVDKLLFRNSSF